MDFEVNRADYRQTRIVDSPPPELANGQVRLAIERFAITTNNITYAVAGDMLDYWGFFPAPSPWGRIPAIGIGSVVESANADIEGPDSLTEFERVQYVDRLSLKFAPEPELYLDEE